MDFVEKTARGLVDDLLIKTMGDLTDKRVLDVGCGNGNFLFKVKDRGAEVLGIDSSKEVVKEAQETYSDIKFMEYDLSIIELRSEVKYDFVVLEFVAMFVEGFDTMLQNIKPLLADEGRVLIVLLHPFFILGEAALSDSFPDDDYFVENVLKISDMGIEEAYFSRPLSWYINHFSNKGYKINQMLEERVTGGIIENIDQYSKIKGIPELVLFDISI